MDSNSSSRQDRYGDCGEDTGSCERTEGRLLPEQAKPNRLLGFDATATGKGFVYGDGKAAQYYVDGLEKAGKSMKWNVRSDKVRRYEVEVRYSTPKTVRTEGLELCRKDGVQGTEGSD
jgi:hypothetical protein